MGDSELTVFEAKSKPAEFHNPTLTASGLLGERKTLSNAPTEVSVIGIRGVKVHPPAPCPSEPTKFVENGLGEGSLPEMIPSRLPCAITVTRRKDAVINMARRINLLWIT